MVLSKILKRFVIAIIWFEFSPDDDNIIVETVRRFKKSFGLIIRQKIVFEWSAGPVFQNDSILFNSSPRYNKTFESRAREEWGIKGDKEKETPGPENNA